MKKRAAAIGIILCMLLCASCSEQKPPIDTDTDTDTDIAGTDTTAVDDSATALGIPSDLRFPGKTFRILATPDANYGPVLDDFVLEDNADVLTMALYERLVNTEERFGITVELNYGVEREVMNVARSAINSGSNDFDMVADVAVWHREAVYEGLYLPVSELTYIDLEKPWWNKAYIESVSIDPDEPYILFGSINLKSIERSVCTLFNIDMLEERKGISEQEMYDIVLEGKWTLDKMLELTKDTYFDENGNTNVDEGDIFGYVHNKCAQVSWLAFSAGLEFTGRDNDGHPVLNLNNERSIDLTDKLIELFCGDDTYNHAQQMGGVEIFSTGRSLFYVNRFNSLRWLRESETEFGIIPPPKYDESIDNYYVAVADNTQWQMVPVTEPDPEFASAVIEYLAYDGYENVIPAYFDITVKFKYTRGDLEGASKMLDIIVGTQRNDFMSVNSLGGMENIFMELCKSGQNTFSSKYASYETAANTKLAEYISVLG